MPGDNSPPLHEDLGQGKLVIDEEELMIPLELGLQTETVTTTAACSPPCSKKLKKNPDVMKGSDSTNGPCGPLVPKSRGLSGVKLLRKLEAQEKARLATQMKLMRTLEKQALAHAAKEARKQQAILAAEERKKQREQIKILKQQEKMRRNEQIKMEKELKAQQLLEEKMRRNEQIKMEKELKAQQLLEEKMRRNEQIKMEKELKAQQLLEARQKKKEEAAKARIMEAEKRMKEKELKRQQVEILKHQERERKRQHLMLMRAVEARKKAEERERLRQEKKDERRLSKERKLEQQRLELEIARELKKPNEDMCLSDHKPLPEFSRIPGLILPGRAVSDCLMLMQFLRGFGKVLGLDLNMDVPTLGMLQEGLLNVRDSMGQVQDLLVKLLSLAVCDPGLPPGQNTKTMLGDHLTNVGINRNNVSEVLQMYMGARCANTDLAPLALSLKTKAFRAHTPVQKASILAFLANELACSRAVIRDIDKNRQKMSNMRKEKLIIEEKLKKLRIIHAKHTGKREASLGVEENQSVGTPSSDTKRISGSGNEEKVNDLNDDLVKKQDNEEEEEVKKVKEVEVYDEDDVDQATSIEELEKEIEKLAKQHHQTTRKLFEISHSLRSMMYGQDRYRRQYWVLPHCGGVFIEAMESGEAPEELEEEEQRRRRAAEEEEEVKVKQEPQEMQLEKEKQDNLDRPSIQTQGLEQQEEEEMDHKGEKNSPALKMPKSLDYPLARPIPEEFLTGWWRVSDIEQLRDLVNALHSRGFREKGLQRQMQKYMEFIPQVCTKHKDVATIELRTSSTHKRTAAKQTNRKRKIEAISSSLP